VNRCVQSNRDRTVRQNTTHKVRYRFILKLRMSHP